MRAQRLITPVVLVAMLVALGEARAHDIANGRTIAQVWCSNCHRIDPHDQGTAHDATPTFVSIAKMKSTTAASLATLLNAHHGGMPNLNLNRKEIDDVSAYILSLRNSP